MKRALFLLFLFLVGVGVSAQDSTYAERLGFPKGARVVILHVDDVGMSWDSNRGAILAMTEGAASSCSIMMPCPWVPAFSSYLQKHPELDAGLHLTLTSEWNEYRWGPVSGAGAVPGLVDRQGALWASVDSVVKYASADEVETEIRAQLQKALKMGIRPTHLDSHMGTLFAKPDFILRYLKVGMENKIPVMFPAGHATLIRKQTRLPEMMIQMIRNLGRQLWAAGLPVLDDLHNTSYDWKLPANAVNNKENLRKFKTKEYIEALHELKPGITMIIMHCTEPTAVFRHISDSGPTRYGDLLAMMDPALKKEIEKEGVILTTWRELMERRSKLANVKM